MTKLMLPWVVKRTAYELDGHPWLTMVSQHVVLPSGREMARHLQAAQRESVCVVALTMDRMLALVRQYKHGLGRVTWEFPAGYLETPNEDPLMAAQRELREETGGQSEHWQYLGAFAREPNRGRSVIHYYLAQQIEKIGVQAPDELEALDDVQYVRVEEIEHLMQDGRMPSLHCLGAWAVARPFILRS